MKTLVYVAGPYTHPEPIENTRLAIDAWKTLVAGGYIALVPHLTLLCQLVYPMPPDFWYEYDLHLLERCDVMLRLPGISIGADIEADHAKAKGIPVFHGTAHQFIESNVDLGPFKVKRMVRTDD